MIIDDMKKDNMLAMREHNQMARDILSVVMNKVMLVNIELRKDGKELTDADVIQIVQKTMKDLTEDSENYRRAKNDTEAENVLKQRDYLAKYLPQMMSEEEIRSIIDNMEDKSIGNIMRTFKTQYAGKVDMALVNKIARG